MNRKLLFVGVWMSILSLISCKSDKRNAVTYKEFIQSPIVGELVQVKNNDCSLLGIKEIITKSRLQSKTTTILTAKILLESDGKVAGQTIYFSFIKKKRIPKYLKSKKDRDPYILEFEKSIRTYELSSFNIDSSFEYIIKDELPILTEVIK